MHLITLVIEIGELSTGSKVKGDFLLKVPVDKMQIQNVKTKSPIVAVEFKTGVIVKTLIALLATKPLNTHILSTYLI